jgi:hypothetical protein
MPRFEPSVADAHKLLPEVVVDAAFGGLALDEQRLGQPMNILLHLVKHLVANGSSRQDLLDLLA